MEIKMLGHLAQSMSEENILKEIKKLIASLEANKFSEFNLKEIRPELEFFMTVYITKMTGMTPEQLKECERTYKRVQSLFNPNPQ